MYFFVFFQSKYFYTPLDMIDEPTVEQEMKCRYLTTNSQSNSTMMPCVLRPVSACRSVRKCCLFNVDCTFMRMFYWIRFDFYVHPPVRPSPCEKQKQAWGHCEGVTPVLNDFPQVYKTRARGVVDSWWPQILVCHDSGQTDFRIRVTVVYWVISVYISTMYFHCSSYSKR